MLQRMQEESQAKDGDESESEGVSIHTSINEVVEEQSTTIQCVQPVVPLISPPQQQQLQPSSSNFPPSSNNMGFEDITLGSSNEALDVIIPQLKIEDVEKVDCHELHPIVEDEVYIVDFEEDVTKVFDSYGGKGVHEGKSSTQDVSVLAQLHKIRGRVFKHQGFATQQRFSSIVVWWELKFGQDSKIVGALGSSQGEVDKFQTRDIWHKGQLYLEEGHSGPSGSSIGTFMIVGRNCIRSEFCRSLDETRSIGTGGAVFGTAYASLEAKHIHHDGIGLTFTFNYAMSRGVSNSLCLSFCLTLCPLSYCRYLGLLVDFYAL